MRLQFNPDIVVHPFDGAGSVPRMVCEIPHSSGRPVCVLLAEMVVSALQKCPPANDVAELAGSMSAQSNGRVAVSHCTQLIEQQLIPRSVVVDLDAASVLNSMKRRDDYLTVKVPLLRRSVVMAVSERLLWLCTPPAVVLVLVAVLLAQLAVILNPSTRGTSFMSDLSLGDAAILAGLITLQVIWHEVGHATALVRYGGKRPEIGWGIYIWYSVLFTDLSEAWQMPRKSRLRIDLAGMYFQSMFIFIFSLLWLRSHNHIWLYAIYASDLHLASNLNPFLRMDGYWALIDGLGLTTLREFSVVRLFRKKGSEEVRRVGQLPPWTIRVAQLYVISSVAFYGVLLFVLAGQMRRFAATLPAFLASFHQIAGSSPRAGFHLAVILLWRLLVFLLGCAVFVRMIVRLVKAVLPGLRLRSFVPAAAAERGVSRA